MKRGKLVSVGLFVLAAVAMPATAKAQYVFLGGGASIPNGDFKDEAKTGWMAQAGVGYDIAAVKGLWVEAEGFYGSNKHKAPDDGDKTNLFAGIAALGYSFTPDSKVSPYVLAGAGILNHKFVPATGTSESESKFAYSGAVGIGYNASSSVHVWLEGRVLGSKSSRVIPISLGFTYNFSKKAM